MPEDKKGSAWNIFPAHGVGYSYLTELGLDFLGEICTLLVAEAISFRGVCAFCILYDIYVCLYTHHLLGSVRTTDLGLRGGDE